MLFLARLEIACQPLRTFVSCSVIPASSTMLAQVDLRLLVGSNSTSIKQGSLSFLRFLGLDSLSKWISISIRFIYTGQVAVARLCRSHIRLMAHGISIGL